ncbi:YciI family protein [Streptomyces sp. I5]|uniref:YciI family protein n=1 Tax=Streptomyces sp. I5 TaxID=2759947 RepID=UPI001E48C29D|nr:YciI family protein [Streptomyces sp. I5]
MTRYLISFDDGAMTFPEEELPEVAKASHEVVRQAQDAGVWVFGGGLESQQASVVATDGTVTDGPYPETKAVLGGFSIIDVPSREDALGVGRQDRRRVPLCAGGPGDHARGIRLIAHDPRRAHRPQDAPTVPRTPLLGCGSISPATARQVRRTGLTQRVR